MSFARYLVPNGLTSLNLLCGSSAIIFMFESQLDYPYVPVILIACSALFDVLDGLVAKLLNATSEFGKQLDSLADLISFGLAPSIMIYKLLVLSFIYNSESATFLIENVSVSERLVLYTSLIFVVFAACRLARFNITSSTNRDFVGLPVPAAALVIVSVWIEFHLTNSEVMQGIILNKFTLFSLIAITSLLMVSKLPMLSLKFNGISFKENSWQYILIVGSVLLYIVLGSSALFFVMVFYLLLSVIKHISFPDTLKDLSGSI